MIFIWTKKRMPIQLKYAITYTTIKIKIKHAINKNYVDMMVVTWDSKRWKPISKVQKNK